jgi:ElaB/YqjD/DUF883 family membrane-anchored ribosome-binding protein
METTTELRDAATGLKDTIRNRGSQISSAALEQSRRVKEMADFYAHEHTWKTIGIVALAAVALGWLLGNSTRRD